MTLADYKSELADLLNGGTAFSSSTTPALTQIVSWVNAAVRYIVDNTKGDMHQDIVKIIDGSTPELTPSYIDLSGFAVPVYRVDSLSIKDYDSEGKYVPCTFCNMKEYTVAYHSPFQGTLTSPIYTRSGDTIYILPGGIRFKYLITYIKTWTEMSDDAHEPAVPEDFTDAIIEYVIYLFYKQQQQLDLEISALKKTNDLIISATRNLGGTVFIQPGLTSQGAQ